MTHFVAFIGRWKVVEVCRAPEELIYEQIHIIDAFITATFRMEHKKDILNGGPNAKTKSNPHIFRLFSTFCFLHYFVCYSTVNGSLQNSASNYTFLRAAEPRACRNIVYKNMSKCKSWD